MKNTITLLVLVSMLKAEDAAITAWTTPTLSTANRSVTQNVDEDHNTTAAILTLVATGTGTVTYSLVSAVTPFAVSTSGALTITAALDFETTASYTLKIQAVDSATPPGSGTATISVIVTDVNEAPAFVETKYETTIADYSTAGSTVFTATATDQDSGDKIAYSIAAGNTNSHFTMGSSTGVITVNTNVTLVACTTYALQIKAKDDDSTPLTGTASLYIDVTPCSGTSLIVVSTVMILFAALLTILQ